MSVSGIDQLLGQGLAFPLRVDGDGRLALSAGEDNVRQSLRMILMTQTHERVMRPQYGAGLRELLYEPNTPTTRELIRQHITRAVARWERRVTVESVEVTPDPEEPRRVVVSLVYRLVSTGGLERMGLALELEG